MDEQSGIPRPPKPSGAQHRSVHVDAVSEALARGGKRKGQRRPRRQLRDFAIRQLKRSEKLQRQLDKAIENAIDNDGEISAVLVQAAQTAKALTDTMMTAIEQVRRSEKAEAEKLGSLDEEDLSEVLKVYLGRMRWTDEDKRELLSHWFGVDVARVLVPVEVTP